MDQQQSAIFVLIRPTSSTSWELICRVHTHAEARQVLARLNAPANDEKTPTILRLQEDGGNRTRTLSYYCHLGLGGQLYFDEAAWRDVYPSLDISSLDALQRASVKAETLILTSETLSVPALQHLLSIKDHSALNVVHLLNGNASLDMLKENILQVLQEDGSCTSILTCPATGNGSRVALNWSSADQSENSAVSILPGY